MSLGMIDVDNRPELSKAAMAELERLQAKHAAKFSKETAANGSEAKPLATAAPAPTSEPPTPPPRPALPEPEPSPTNSTKQDSGSALPASALSDATRLRLLEGELASALECKDYLKCAQLRDEIHPLRVAQLTAELEAAAAAQDFTRCVEIKEERDKLIQKAEARKKGTAKGKR